MAHRQQANDSQQTNDSQADIIDEPYDPSKDDVKDNPLTHSEKILQSLKLQQANRILLSLAWMDHEALKRMACFPFVLGMDETDRTNCEERPLFCMVGMDSNNHIFPIMHILMPSKSRWAYDWIYNEAIPYLLPEKIRKNTQLLITDQGKELVHMLSASVGVGKTFPNAIHRLCAWHIVDRNYTMEVKKKVPKAKSQAAIDNKFISDVCLWMYSFCTSIESSDHEQAHLQQLHIFIQQSSNVTGSVKSFTQQFLTKSFKEVLEKIVFYKFMYRICGHVKVTSFVEAHNASLHVSNTGPRPNHSLVTSVTRITATCKQKSILKRDMEERNVDRRLAVRFGESPEETASLNHAADVLSPYLTPIIVDRIMEQWNCASNFIYKKDESFVSSFDQNHHFYSVCFLVSWNPTVPRHCHCVVPSWAYIRKVYVIRFEGKRFLQCSCGHSHRYGCACRHMYSLLHRKPEVSDCSPRCMKLYSLQYGTNTDLTDAVNSYLARNQSGLVPLLDTDAVGTEQSRGSLSTEEHSDWFHSTQSNTVVWSQSAVHGSPEEAKDNHLTQSQEEYILQEESCGGTGADLPDMPVFVVPGAPTLMATPIRAPPTKVTAHAPSRGATESQTAYKKRKRDEYIASALRLASKAKTVNEIQYLIDRNDHSEAELNAKHASQDAYQCISDNIGGTISGCIAVTQSPSQGRLKKMNEVPASTKKKLF